MLKFVYLNQKKVPVPVPVKNLYEAILWVEKHILRDGYAITKVLLDQSPVEVLDESSQNLKKVPLEQSQRLEIQIDSVQEISIQTIDALRNLSTALEKSLKPVAVEFWQAGEQSKHNLDLEPVLEDLALILDLISHVEILVQGRVSIANISMIRESLSEHLVGVEAAFEGNQYKLVAKILLQKIETPLEELNHELTMLQNTIFESFADKKFSKIGVG